MVATDVSGCREVVRDGVTGLLVPSRDAEGLADALERLARDANLRHRMGAAAREYVAGEFSEEVVIGQTLALYRSLIPKVLDIDP
jgi:glycosyltransferase involved in cell wall biosynthesis